MQAYLARWVCQEADTNLRRLADESARAADAGARLVVFPEAFLHGYTQRVEAERVRGTFGSISEKHPQTAFAFGSFTEDRRNRMTVWYSGREVAHYDKVHLFAPNDEAALWDPGDRYAAVRFEGWTLGLLTCNDVRFPEQARALRLHARCDALLVAAWWPWRRDDVWRTLLRARAIENGVFVLGCCVAAAETPSERFAGAGNYVFDPHGEPVRTADDRTYQLDPARASGLLVDPLEAHRAIEEVEVFTANR
ncbi:MAG TPA: nitrilase-related carbon-nitrogen hydrolase [Thermoanaerobaculaceae bacterium]|nr:nitrilase-related carbon-nitrogen hydrolase [Thermoanaerobaculaceae bacterium]